MYNMDIANLRIQERPEEGPRVLFPLEAQVFLELVEIGRTDGVSAWHSPAIERRRTVVAEGRGLFALENIPENTLVAIKQLRLLSELTSEEAERNLVGYNHSSDPNAKIMPIEGASLSFVVTHQPVDAGEEITVDLLGRNRGQ
jgi:hypothetical protein